MEGTSFFITPDGSFKLTGTRLSNIDTVLLRLAAETNRRVPAPFMVRGNPAVLSVGQKTWVAAQLPELKINTYYRIEGDALVPRFKSATDTIQTTCTFALPETMKLYFGVQVTYSSGVYVASQYIFFAKSSAATGYFRLPLGNLYSDGRICMGNDFSPTHATIQGLLEACLTHLDGSLWKLEGVGGVDPDLARSAKVFRFSPTTFQSLPVPSDWHTQCTRVSHVAMEELVNGN